MLDHGEQDLHVPELWVHRRTLWRSNDDRALPTLPGRADAGGVADGRRPAPCAGWARLANLSTRALPGQLGAPLCRVRELAVLAPLGPDVLAGLATATAVVTVVSWSTQFLWRATLVDVAHARAHTPERAQAEVTLGLTLALVLAIGASAVLWFASGPDATRGWLPHVDVAASGYLFGSVLGLPGLLVGFVVQGALHGGDHAGRAAAIGATVIAVDVGLTPLLVHTAGLGLAGAALASSTAATVGALAGLRSLRRVGLLTPRWSPSLVGAGRLAHEGLRQLVVSGTIVAVVTGSTACAGGCPTTPSPRTTSASRATSCSAPSSTPPPRPRRS